MQRILLEPIELPPRTEYEQISDQSDEKSAVPPAPPAVEFFDDDSDIDTDTAEEKNKEQDHLLNVQHYEHHIPLLGHSVFIMAEHNSPTRSHFHHVPSRRLIYREMAATRFLHTLMSWQPEATIRYYDTDPSKMAGICIPYNPNIVSFSNMKPLDVRKKLLDTIDTNGFAEHLVTSLVLDNLCLCRSTTGFDENGKVIVTHAGNYFASLDPDIRQKSDPRRQNFSYTDLESLPMLDKYKPQNWLGFFVLGENDKIICSVENDIFGRNGVHFNKNPKFKRALHRAILKWLLKSDDMIKQDVEAGVKNDVVIDGINQSQEMIEFTQARRNLLLAQALQLKSFKTYLASAEAVQDAAKYATEIAAQNNNINALILQAQFTDQVKVFKNNCVAEVAVVDPVEPTSSPIKAFIKKHIKGIWTGGLLGVVFEGILLGEKIIPLTWPVIGFSVGFIVAGIALGAAIQALANYCKGPSTEQPATGVIDNKPVAKSKRNASLVNVNTLTSRLALAAQRSRMAGSKNYDTTVELQRTNSAPAPRLGNE